MKSVIDFANTVVPIGVAISLVDPWFKNIDSSYGGKLHCPFGHINHSDGGQEKSLRLYAATNSAFCFASCGFLNPVRVFSIAYDLKSSTAAYRVLEASGHKMPSIQERWDLAGVVDSSIDLESLQQSLIVFCRSVCGDQAWRALQYKEEIIQLLDSCFQLLELVTSELEVITWLHTCKKVMETKLRSYVRL